MARPKKDASEKNGAAQTESSKIAGIISDAKKEIKKLKVAIEIVSRRKSEQMQQCAELLKAEKTQLVEVVSKAVAQQIAGD